jgi:hypothetical protein
MNGCRMADWGFSRRSGSQTRHLDTKSTKSSSLQRKTWASVFVPGRLLRPFELRTVRGAPLESADVSCFRADLPQAVLTKEKPLPGAPIDELFVRYAKNLHDTG